MDDRIKREIKHLVHGLKDPRAMFAPVWYISFVLSIQFVAVISVLIDVRWGLIFTSAYFVFYAIVIMHYHRRSKRMKAQLQLNQFDLCLWCHYPMVGLRDRSSCTECGCGHDREVAQKLFREMYEPSFRVATIRNRMLRRARWWARAIRERDRDQNDAERLGHSAGFDAR